MKIARALPEWFNELGLRDMNKDFDVEEGFVAEVDDKIVGFITHKPLRKDERELTWIGLLKEFQRKGIGTRLFKRLEKKLKDKGIKWLQVLTVAETEDYEPYERTRNFYHKVGFKDVKIKKKAGGKKEDMLVLKKEIG